MSGGTAEQLFSRPPFHRFREFIDPAKSRFQTLNALLNELGLPYSVVQLGANRHFFISPPSKEKPAVVLAAHYDAVPGSPGANDNASGVFLLAAAALELHKTPGPSWLIVFTDKEELSEDEGLRSQGSYALARALKNTDLSGADFFVFDACGRGDALVVSTAADHLLKTETGWSAADIQKKLKSLRRTALDAAERVFGPKRLLLPTPFSDDAGFLRAGLAAQTITVLPEGEAARVAQLSRSNPDYARSLISRTYRAGIEVDHIPPTWRLINGPADSIESLTPETFPKIIQFAAALASRTR
ncbi:MAG: M28 family peptidase [Spirochaetaceae bacterium]|jgi:hypothetical protein|nr:M28 family peptidase [Spirochaetaceae bacterium]